MKIIWAEPAISDLESIRDYIAKDSDLFACDFVEKSLKVVETLCELPCIGRHVPEIKDKDLREIIFKSNYRIIYRINENSVLIVAIIHAARNIRKTKSYPWDKTG